MNSTMRRRRIGIGFDVQLQECVCADAEHRKKDDEHNIAVAEKNADEGLHVYWASCARRSSAPVVTIRSPSFRPCRISSLSVWVSPRVTSRRSYLPGARLDEDEGFAAVLNDRG